MLISSLSTFSSRDQDIINKMLCKRNMISVPRKTSAQIFQMSARKCRCVGESLRGCFFFNLRLLNNIFFIVKLISADKREKQINVGGCEIKTKRGEREKLDSTSNIGAS